MLMGNLRIRRLLVHRVADSMTSYVQYMRENPSGANVLIAQKLLDRANVIARFQEVCGEGMPGGVATGMFDHARIANNSLTPSALFICVE